MATYPVVILAGGLATRMRPLTETVPKAMLEVAGRPFIDHQLRQIHAQGVRQVVLALGFLGEQVATHIGDGSRFGLDVSYSYDGDTLLGTGGAVRKAALGLEGPFFVLYGDSYLPIDWTDVADRYRSGGRPALMTVFHNEGRWDTSNVIYDGAEILLYDKRRREPAMQYIDYGLEIMTAAAFADCPPGAAFDLAEVLTKLVAERKVTGYEVTQRFYEIGSIDGYRELDTLLKSSAG